MGQLRFEFKFNLGVGSQMASIAETSGMMFKLKNGQVTITEHNEDKEVADAIKWIACDVWIANESCKRRLLHDLSQHGFKNVV